LGGIVVYIQVIVVFTVGAGY